MAAPPTNYASASLYVGDLANDVTEALLFENFNAVGQVASVRVCRDAATRRSLGYAYVNFHRVEDAERALDTMNFKPISRGRPCRIMWSHRDPSLRKSGLGNIFVKNLDPIIDNKTLYDTFSMFGNILSCKVATRPNGESLKYGFVHYEGEQSAIDAIARVNNKVIGVEKVSVCAFKSRVERGGNGKFKFTNVYVKNIPPDINHATLNSMFDSFGRITSCMIAMDKDGVSRGFGFINYSSPEEAQTACEKMNQHEIGDKKLFVVRAQKKEEREKELRERFEQFKVEKQRKYAGVNVYVKNLSDQIDDAKLREEFSKFGAITSARVMVENNTNKSRGFGFVCFSSQEEATKAVTEMMSKMLDNKPLYVALAQRKDVRRQQLEQAYAARAKGVNGPMPGQPQMFPGQPGGPGPMGAPQGYYPPQQRFYPPQMMRQWNPAQGGAPSMMGPPHLGVNYQLMAINQRGAGGRGGGGRGGQSTGRGRGGGKGQQQGGAPGGVSPGPYKFADNVRNQRDQQPRAQTQQAPIADQGQPDRLTHTALAEAPDETRKQMIGERLFPLIKAMAPASAGKITGMLLEMDNGELLHLLESNSALKEKVEEATQVLSEWLAAESGAASQ